MAHLEYRVNGETVYEGDVPDAIIPSRPEMFPKALALPGSGVDANAEPTPLARLTVLTSFIRLVCMAIEQSPQLRPVTAQPKFHGVGEATIEINMALPEDL